MRTHQQYQPPHQIHPIIAKFDRLLDMMESRMDAVDRRVENLRRKQYPIPHQSGRSRNLCPPIQPEPKPPYISSRWDPPDRRPRTGNQPIGYRDRAQDVRARPRSGYAERSHLFDRGDQRIQLGFDRHPIRAPQPHSPTCWDPPTQQQDRGYPTFDHLPRRTETCWDRPHHQEEVRELRGHSACHQPRHTAAQPPRLILPPRDLYGQPARVTNQTPYPPPRSPTCWDFDDYEESASDSDGYDEDFDVGYSRQPYHQRHSMMPQRPPYFTRDSCCHPTTQLRQAVARLEQPAAEQQPLFQRPPLCQQPLSGNIDVDLNLEREGDSPSSPSYVDNSSQQRCCGSDDEDDVDGVDVSSQQHNLVQPMTMELESCEIGSLPTIYEDYVTPKIIENLRPHKIDHTSLQALACVYVDVNVSDVTSMNPRLPSLDADARLIPPLNSTPCLSIHECVAELSILALNLDDHISLPLLVFYGGREGRRSVVQCVFDPGGDASSKPLLSTLFVASWFPP